MFDKIMGAIFGKASAAPSAAPTPEPAMTGAGAGATAATMAGADAGTAGLASSVDVATILDQAVAGKGEKLDWRHSIVDLMKALGLDSSLAARKELAQELKYDGDMNDSAAMNMWLHKALMKKLADNGGKVPTDLTA